MKYDAPALAVNGSDFTKQLIETGILPARSFDFVLKGKAGGVYVMEIHMFASPAEMEQIANAFKDNPEEASRIARKLFLHGLPEVLREGREQDPPLEIPL